MSPRRANWVHGGGTAQALSYRSGREPATATPRPVAGASSLAGCHLDVRANRCAKWSAVLGAAVLIRLLTWHHAPPSDPARNVFDGDCHYHRFRAEQIVRDFPHVQWQDPELGGGIDIPWPPLFDEVIASVAMVIGGGRASRADVALAAAWTPVAIGAATIPLVGMLASLLAGPGMAIGAGLVLALSTSHVMFSLLGRSDQHVLELTLLVLLLISYSKGLAAEGAWERVATCAAMGVIIVLSFWNWLGSALYLLFVASFVAAWHVLTPSSRPRANRPAAVLALGAGVGSAMLALTVAWFGRPSALRSTSIHGVTGLHVALVAGAAVFGALLWWRRSLAPGAGCARRAAELLLTALLPLALAAIHPGMRDGIWHGLLALLRGNRWYSSIGEFRPLLFGGGEPVWTEIGEALAWYGLVPLVAAFGASVVLERWRHAVDRSPQSVLLLTWGATSFALAILERRFSLYASAPLAILAWAGIEGARRRWVPHRCRPVILNTTVAIVLIAPVVSLGQAVLMKPPAVSPSSLLVWLEGQGDAMASRAVYTRWSWGHHARVLARRPALANPFGIEGGASIFEESLRTFLSVDEEEFLHVLERNHAGYLLNEDPHGELVYQDMRPPGTPPLAKVRAGWRRGLEIFETELARRRIAYRLYSADGSSTGDLPALVSFRVLRETEPLDRATSARPGFVLFGVVPGARLSVTGACPGEEVTATTVVRTSTGREFTWRAVGRTEAAGTTVLRVPYATGKNGSSDARAFEVVACSGTRMVDVPEDAVVTGAPVAVALPGPPTRAATPASSGAPRSRAAPRPRRGPRMDNPGCAARPRDTLAGAGEGW